MLQPFSSKAVKQAALAKGSLAEDLVAQWLTGQGWEILERRWHCPYGELDLVAHRGSGSAAANLVFVEQDLRRVARCRGKENSTS